MFLSIIVPVFNTEKHLEECLISVLNQDFTDYEIILIDDGSTDHSSLICQKYAATHDFISLIQKENTGQGDSRNIGIRLAKGEFIMFLDSDDTLAADCLTLFHAKMKNETDVITSDITKVYQTRSDYFKNYIDFHKQSNINLMLSHPGPIAKVIRRALIIENEIFFETGKIFEDLLFNVKLGMYANTVEYLPVSTYNYFIRDKSTMQSAQYDSRFDDIYDVFDVIFPLLKDYPAENEFLHIEHILYSATLRALKYSAKLEQLSTNVELVQQRFPHYLKNEYIKQKSVKFRVIVYLLSKKLFFFVRFLLGLRGY